MRSTSRLSKIVKQIGFLAALVFILPSSAYAACSNPAGDAGKMIYNTDESMMQYCDGTNWVGVGK